MIHLKNVWVLVSLSKKGIERFDSKCRVAHTTSRNGHVLVLATVFVYLEFHNHASLNDGDTF